MYNILRAPELGVAERRDNARVLGHPRACLNAARQTPCEASCVSRETLASRRSTVAILGSGPALPSPAALLRFRLGEQPDRSQRAPRIRVVVPGGRGPGA